MIICLLLLSLLLLLEHNIDLLIMLVVYLEVLEQVSHVHRLSDHLERLHLLLT